MGEQRSSEKFLVVTVQLESTAIKQDPKSRMDHVRSSWNSNKGRERAGQSEGNRLFLLRCDSSPWTKELLLRSGCSRKSHHDSASSGNQLPFQGIALYCSSLGVRMPEGKGWRLGLVELFRGTGQTSKIPAK